MCGWSEPDVVFCRPAMKGNVRPNRVLRGRTWIQNTLQPSEKAVPVRARAVPESEGISGLEGCPE